MNVGLQQTTVTLDDDDDDDDVIIITDPETEDESVPQVIRSSSTGREPANVIPVNIPGNSLGHNSLDSCDPSSEKHRPIYQLAPITILDEPEDLVLSSTNSEVRSPINKSPCSSTLNGLEPISITPSTTTSESHVPLSSSPRGTSPNGHEPINVTPCSASVEGHAPIIISPCGTSLDRHESIGESPNTTISEGPVPVSSSPRGTSQNGHEPTSVASTSANSEALVPISSSRRETSRYRHEPISITPSKTIVDDYAPININPCRTTQNQYEYIGSGLSNTSSEGLVPISSSPRVITLNGHEPITITPCRTVHVPINPSPRSTMQRYDGPINTVPYTSNLKEHIQCPSSTLPGYDVPINAMPCCNAPTCHGHDSRFPYHTAGLHEPINLQLHINMTEYRGPVSLNPCGVPSAYHEPHSLTPYGTSANSHGPVNPSPTGTKRIEPYESQGPISSLINLVSTFQEQNGSTPGSCKPKKQISVDTAAERPKPDSQLSNGAISGLQSINQSSSSTELGLAPNSIARMDTPRDKSEKLNQMHNSSSQEASMETTLRKMEPDGDALILVKSESGSCSWYTMSGDVQPNITGESAQIPNRQTENNESNIDESEVMMPKILSVTSLAAMHHGTDDPKGKDFSSGIEPESGTKRNSRECDIKISKISKDKRSIRKGEKKKVKCEYCDKLLATKQNLRVHMRIHTGENLHKCEFCDKKFIWKTSLDYHKSRCLRTKVPNNKRPKRKMVSVDKRFECDYCGEYLNTHYDLNIHLETHSVANPYTCKYCGRRFICKSSRDSHIKEHVNEKPAISEHSRGYAEGSTTDTCLSVHLNSAEVTLDHARESGTDTGKGMIRNSCNSPISKCIDKVTQKRETGSPGFTHTGGSKVMCNADSFRNTPTKRDTKECNINTNSITMAEGNELNTHCEPHCITRPSEQVLGGNFNCYNAACNRKNGCQCSNDITNSRGKEQLCDLTSDYDFNIGTPEKKTYLNTKGNPLTTTPNGEKRLVKSRVGEKNESHNGEKISIDGHNGEETLFTSHTEENSLLRYLLVEKNRTTNGEDSGGKTPNTSLCRDKSPECSDNTGIVPVGIQDGAISTSPSGIKLSVPTNRTGEGTISCGQCDRSFPNEGSLALHMWMHTREKVARCQHCSQCFSTKLALEDHIKTHARGKLECEHCGKRFQFKSQLVQHQMIHTGEKPFKCDYCGRHFRRRQALTNHVRIHTGEKPYECEECGRRFIQYGAYAVHRKIHNRKLYAEKIHKCEHCGKCFSFKSQLVKHKMIHTGEKPFKCDYCGRRFRLRASLTLHVRIHTGEKPYKCEECGRRFTQYGAYAVHRKIHNRKMPAEKIYIHNSKTPAEKMYKCEYCGQCFRWKGGLVSHRRIHTGEKPFQCDYCGKRFRHHGSRKVHVRIHTGEKPYRCDDCGKRFSQSGCLSIHRKAHCKKRCAEKIYKCEHCDKSFGCKSDLEKHRTVHSVEKPLECEYCGKSFKFKGALQRHVRVHTGEKPYGCDECGKRFTQRGYLTIHRKAHCKARRQAHRKILNSNMPAEKTYKCEHCGKVFGSKSNLEYHSVVHSVEKPFECEYCGKSFKRKVSLRVHVRIHTGEKPYGCDQCGKRFTQSGSLALHRKTHSRKIQKH